LDLTKEEFPLTEPRINACDGGLSHGEDIEYRRVGNEKLLARIYRPARPGPFPAVVSIHGGAWTSGDRVQNAPIDKALAAAGVVVVDLDFRMPPKFRYPASVADINYGIRWLKSNAEKLGTRSDWVGAVGASSGAHQMLLNLLDPNNSDYVAEELSGVDADLNFAVACWPITDPLARYRMALERKNERLVAAHHAFFPSEQKMGEANPQAILERARDISLPPLLVLQGTKDDNVTPDMAARFASAYRRAGGHAVLKEFPDQPHTFVTKDPTAPASLEALGLICNFVTNRGL
jgi:acetyl esterase